MLTITVNNVNEALFPAKIALFGEGVRANSRAGEVVYLPYPVCTIYTNPKQRVLYIPERKCNPFFHLFESLWIMAGRRDVAFVSKFNPRMKEFSDDGGVFNAAYGHRLRYNFKIDQIVETVNYLKREPGTRRAVMQIWDAFQDLATHSNDIPCNDLIMFNPHRREDEDGEFYILDMTICCRSNDMIWGAYGANAVHFSVLHEVAASTAGMQMGRMYQFSNNFHVYTSNPFYKHMDKLTPGWNPYAFEKGWNDHVPLVTVGTTIEEWLKDAERFCGLAMEYTDHRLNNTFFTNRWFDAVALPMLEAWYAHKEHKNGMAYTRHIEAADWRAACRKWLYENGETRDECGTL